MKMTKHILAVGAAICILSGCASVDITKTAKGFHDPTSPADVMILKTRPEKSYEELGVLTVTGFAPSETAKMHNEEIYTDPWAGPVKNASGVAIAYKKS